MNHIENTERAKTKEEALNNSLEAIKKYTTNDSIKQMIKALELEERKNIENNTISDDLLSKLSYYNMMESYKDENGKKATR
jgi:hypothetical protein